MKYFKIFLTFAIFLIFFSLSLAEIPNLINFQGILDSAGNPLANKTVSVEFKIYNAPAGGTAYWSETQSVTTNAGGVFNVLLGSSNPIPDSVFDDTLRWLGIKVGTDAEMTPRQQIVSNAYGYRVATVDGATGGVISGDVDIQSNLTISGNVRMIQNPLLPEPLVIVGDLDASDGIEMLRFEDRTTGVPFCGVSVSGDITTVGDVNCAAINANRRITGSEGGTFTSSIFVQPVFTFKRGNDQVGPYWVCENPSGGTVASMDESGNANFKKDVVVDNKLTAQIMEILNQLAVGPGGVKFSNGSIQTEAAGPGNFVSLQPSTPVTPQTGHLGVTGTGKFGIVEASQLFAPELDLESASPLDRISLINNNGTFTMLKRNCSPWVITDLGPSLSREAQSSTAAVCQFRLDFDGDIVATGDVGIGTTTLGAKLHVQNDNPAAVTLKVLCAPAQTAPLAQFGVAGGNTAGEGPLQETIVGSVSSTGNIQFVGTCTMGEFVGDGFGITNLNADNLATGTISDARLSTNICRLNSANTFTTGTQTIQTGGAGNTGLAVQSAAGQTADILVLRGEDLTPHVRFSPGTVGFDLDSDGKASFSDVHVVLNAVCEGNTTLGDAISDNFTCNATSTFNNTVTVNSGASTNKCQVLKMAAGQTASAWEIQNSTGDVLVGVNAQGALGAQTVAAQGMTTNLLGVGTTSPSEALHVVGNICATGTIGECSDLRYKTNLKTVPNALEKVLNLKGIYFNWKKEQYPDLNFEDDRQIGFVAQELKEILPEVVSQGTDGFYSVDYGKLTPLLVEAIKEQQQTIQSLSSQLTELRKLVRDHLDNGKNKLTLNQKEE